VCVYIYINIIDTFNQQGIQGCMTFIKKTHSKVICCSFERSDSSNNISTKNIKLHNNHWNKLQYILKYIKQKNSYF